MNNVKHTTFRDRIRAAYRAFIGKPIGHLTFGVEVKRCGNCERGHCEDCSFKEYTERISSLPDCNTCQRARYCSFAPKIGEQVRINCPLYSEEVNT